MSGSCGFITELVEVYKGLGYREDEWGVDWRGGVCVHHGGTSVRSPICGISARRALWSLNSVDIAVMVVGGGCCASVGIRINQWSRGVLFGVHVCVQGSPK